MEVIVKPTDEKEVVAVKHQLGKMVFSTTAGFLANKVAENVYDALLTRYQARKLTKNLS